MTIKTTAICHKMLILLFHSPQTFQKAFLNCLPSVQGTDFSSSCAENPAHISWIWFKNIQVEICTHIFHRTWVFKFHCIFF